MLCRIINNLAKEFCTILTLLQKENVFVYKYLHWSRHDDYTAIQIFNYISSCLDEWFIQLYDFQFHTEDV